VLKGTSKLDQVIPVGLGVQKVGWVGKVGMEVQGGRRGGRLEARPRPFFDVKC
jgi:hypothetical protein